MGEKAGPPLRDPKGEGGRTAHRDPRVPSPTGAPCALFALPPRSPAANQEAKAALGHPRHRHRPQHLPCPLQPPETPPKSLPSARPDCQRGWRGCGQEGAAHSGGEMPYLGHKIGRRDARGGEELREANSKEDSGGAGWVLGPPRPAILRVPQCQKRRGGSKGVPGFGGSQEGLEISRVLETRGGLEEEGGAAPGQPITGCFLFLAAPPCVAPNFPSAPQKVTPTPWGSGHRGGHHGAGAGCVGKEEGVRACTKPPAEGWEGMGEQWGLSPRSAPQDVPRGRGWSSGPPLGPPPARSQLPPRVSRGRKVKEEKPSLFLSRPLPAPGQARGTPRPGFPKGLCPD